MSAEKFLSAGISLQLLNNIQWRDENGKKQKFRLINRVCSKWESFAYRLELPQNMLDAWRKECLNNSAHCWLKVMQHWLTGGNTPEYPATWDGLYELLKDVEYSEVARELREAVVAANVGGTRDGECCSPLHVNIFLQCLCLPPLCHTI